MSETNELGALPSKRQRSAAALDAARGLLDELELGQGPIINAILKAKRLARLQRDADAERWLDFEARGYPSGFNIKTLGTCAKYANAGGRFTQDRSYYPQSLPQLEAEVRADMQFLEGVRFPSQIAPSASSSNPNELVALSLERATNRITATIKETAAQTRTRLSNTTLLFNGLKSALHSFAADTAVSLEFGDVAQTLFEDARAKVDTFVRTVAPKAAQQLLAAVERFDAGDPESLSHALTSCRRLLMTIADAIFPPRENYKDSKGKERKVGTEQYKNRIIAFIDEAQVGGSSAAILEKEIEHLAGRLDAVYEKTCKGVHADVSGDEVRIVIVGMYMLLAELAHVHQSAEDARAANAASAGPTAPQSSS
jgi:hypothetical protein